MASLLQTIKVYIFTIFRSIIKSIMRSVTRTCEIQRCLKQENYRKLEQSILNSNQLVFAKSYIKERMKGEEMNTIFIKEIFRFKEIQNTTPNMNVFKNGFQKMFNMFRSLRQLDETRIIKYDGCKDHVEGIQGLWKQLKPNYEVPDVISEKWMDIGFQGNNPGTDFRGSGMLALENLLYFCSKYNLKAKKCLDTSNKKDSQYLFACAGINLTMFLFKFIVISRGLDELFYHCEKIEEVLKIFDEIYSNLFLEMNEFWVDNGKGQMMEFHSQIHKNFFPKIKSLKNEELYKQIGVYPYKK